MRRRFFDFRFLSALSKAEVVDESEAAFTGLISECGLFSEDVDIRILDEPALEECELPEDEDLKR